MRWQCDVGMHLRIGPELSPILADLDPRQANSFGPLNPLPSAAWLLACVKAISDEIADPLSGRGHSLRYGVNLAGRRAGCARER